MLKLEIVSDFRVSTEYPMCALCGCNTEYIYWVNNVRRDAVLLTPAEAEGTYTECVTVCMDCSKSIPTEYDKFFIPAPQEAN